jgi:hypothetical protein
LACERGGDRMSFSLYKHGEEWYWVADLHALPALPECVLTTGPFRHLEPCLSDALAYVRMQEGTVMDDAPAGECGMDPVVSRRYEEVTV